MNYTYYPTWLSPDVIHPSIQENLPSWLNWLSFLKWYGLMYVVATIIIFSLFNWQVKRDRKDIPSQKVEDFFMWGIIGMLLGARIMATLIWDNTIFYLTNPWFIFLPFSSEWEFIGFQGMAFHGGLIGLILGCWLYTKKNKYNFWEWMDWLAASFPLGYTFGRLGNFFNAELYGRPTKGGMIFPDAQPFSISEPGLLNFIQEINLPLEAGKFSINLPRHPSQLYEATGEGILLFLFLWFFIRPRKKFQGELASCFLMGYGAIRFIIEYFRDPSDELGFIIHLKETDIFNTSLLNISLGQIFSLVMVLIGAVLWKLLKNKKIIK